MTRGSPQQQFAIADLAAVNRTKTPFVVVTWHRLMYSGAAVTDSGEWLGHAQGCMPALKRGRPPGNACQGRIAPEART